MESSIKFYCDSRDAGQRLDVFLAARLGSLSRMRIARLLAAGACVLNGTTGAAGQKLSAGDHIEITLGAAEPTAMTPERLPACSSTRRAPSKPARSPTRLPTT
jgi:23S rRNA-/tRNA-specific pseudouridylate synthase